MSDSMMDTDKLIEWAYDDLGQIVVYGEALTAQEKRDRLDHAIARLRAAAHNLGGGTQ